MRRLGEFILVLVVVTVVVRFTLREEAEEPAAAAPVATTSPAPETAEYPSETRTPVNSPFFVYEKPPGFSNEEWHRRLGELAWAEGMAGFEESLVSEEPPQTSELIARGKVIYEFNCALCHGTFLRGDGEGGAALDPAPTDLLKTKNYKYGSNPRSIYRTARFGVEGTGMAPWGGILSEENLWAVSHFVHSQQK